MCPFSFRFSATVKNIIYIAHVSRYLTSGSVWSIRILRGRPFGTKEKYDFISMYLITLISAYKKSHCDACKRILKMVIHLIYPIRSIRVVVAFATANDRIIAIVESVFPKSHSSLANFPRRITELLGDEFVRWLCDFQRGIISKTYAPHIVSRRKNEAYENLIRFSSRLFSSYWKKIYIIASQTINIEQWTVTAEINDSRWN